MNGMKFSQIVIFVFMLISFTGCEFIGDVFEFGVWVGIFIVVFVVALIIWLIRKLF